MDVAVAVGLLFDEPLEAVGVDVAPMVTLFSGEFIEQAWISRDRAMSVSANRLR